MAVFKGHLVLVVGPSGAGKDSVLNGAKAEFAEDGRFVFPQRFVTRLSDPGSEDHLTMSDMEFAIAVASDAFALWWQAHGNSYGIPSAIESELMAGSIVAVNCSRAILADAVDRYPHVTIVEITAPEAILVNRIMGRGRETEEQAWARVTRKVADYPSGVPVVRIANDGPLVVAVSRFCELLVGLENSISNPRRDPLDREDEHEDGDDDRRSLIVVEHLERDL
jgi:ribose 1,5-bisphosphokinase